MYYVHYRHMFTFNERESLDHHHQEGNARGSLTLISKSTNRNYLDG